MKGADFPRILYGDGADAIAAEQRYVLFGMTLSRNNEPNVKRACVGSYNKFQYKGLSRRIRQP